MKYLVLSIVAMMLAACGTQSEEQQAQPAPQAEEQAGATEAAVLPNVVIARVPLDDEGNELVGEIETKLVSVDQDNYTAEASEDAFASAEDSVVIANELDGDTSSDSYRYYRGQRAGYFWNTPWYPGKLLGRGTLWGRNPYVAYGRSNYRYNYYGRYNCNRGGRNYRYYSYNRW